jgi:ubiquinone/menaquinone biosynthesis C-methylase UbiE
MRLLAILGFIGTTSTCVVIGLIGNGATGWIDRESSSRSLAALLAPPARSCCALVWFAGRMSEDDPVTGRRMLTGSAYADDRHLRSRMAIYAYAETAGDRRWRTAVIPWDGTQIVADVGCGNGFDLRQIVPQGRCRHAIGLDLSAGMLRSLEELRQSGGLSLVQADAQRLPLPDESVDVAMAMHMLYHVPDIQAAIRELRRITKPGGTVLASTNSSVHLAEINELLDAAVSSQLGRPVHAILGPHSFTTQSGAAILSQEFSSVTLRTFDVPLSIPTAQPVIAYVASIREPVLAWIVEPLDFDAVLDDIAAQVEQVIQAQGSFRTSTRMGVFACR